ncbi:MAG: tetratricopeptide repeat protein [Blastocatellia bacterium]
MKVGKASKKMRGRYKSFLGVLALLSLTLVSAAFGCGWFVTSEESLRFYGLPEITFSRLDPFPRLVDGVTGKGVDRGSEIYGREESVETLVSVRQQEKYKARDRREAEIPQIRALAEKAEAEGDLMKTREILRKFLRLTAIERDITNASDQWQRNSAIDRLDAMSALDQGVSAAAVSAYLKARQVYDKEEPAEAEKLLGVVPADQGLRDNVSWLRAAIVYRQDRYEEAARAFADHAGKYSRSEKRDAALFMQAVAGMKLTKAFQEEEEAVSYYERVEGGSATKKSRTLVEYERAEQMERKRQRRDDAWQKVMDNFARVIREYPHGRYTQDARGWRAFMFLRTGDRPMAMLEYYRMLAGDDANARVEAAISLGWVRDFTKDDDLAKVELILQNEPAAAMAYAYHGIYNYAQNPSYSVNSEDYSWESETRIRQAQTNSELLRVAAFATRMIERYQRSAIHAGFMLRVAQVNLETGRSQGALQMARRALTAGLSGDERVQGLWVKGFAEHRRRNYRSARQTVSTLIREFPDSPRIEGARRLLVMVEEDAGNLAGALEQYMALEYGRDVAYFIDVLLTPGQLAGFIRLHPRTGQDDKLNYALGVRMMRAGRWDEARAAYARVRTISCETPCGREWLEPQKTCWPKLAHSDQPGVCEAWVRKDLQTVGDLERLEHNAAEAGDDESRAEALYQLASYQFQDTTLLFYNSEAWGGVRHYLLSGFTGRTPGETQLLSDYMQSHETPARALNIYLDIVNRYPRTRAARDALYTAAVCHERLSDYYEYWRDLYSDGGHAGARMVTYADVRKTYPGYQLPAGTQGWEPMTRTVNGGPGFAPPPPRPIRLTRWQKMNLLVEGAVWQGREVAREKALALKQRCEQAAMAVWEEVMRPALYEFLLMLACVTFVNLTMFTISLIDRQNQRAAAWLSGLSLLDKGPSGGISGESRVDRIINARAGNARGDASGDQDQMTSLTSGSGETGHAES